MVYYKWFRIGVALALSLLNMSSLHAQILLKDSVLLVGPLTDSLEEEMFRDREDIREVRFDEASEIRILPTGIFRGCSNLRKILLPPKLERIGAHSFTYCESLEEVPLPSALRRIGNNAFSRCRSLREVSVPDSVVELESYAFSDCFSLRRTKLPANDSMLGELIFSGCESLELIEEPSEVPPPFDCGSYIFEPEEKEMYRRCRLKVRPTALADYAKAPGWTLFKEQLISND